MKTIAVLFYILCGLDALIALCSLLFICNKSTTSTITPYAIVFILLCAGAILWANQLKKSNHPIGSISVAGIPVLIGITVLVLLYFSLRKMRLF